MSFISESGAITDPNEIASEDFLEVAQDDFYEQHATRNEDNSDEEEAYLVEQGALLTSLDSLCSIRNELLGVGGISRQSAAEIKRLTASTESIVSFFENHPDKSFTLDKSRVNYAPTCESMAAAIADQVKKIAKAVIEYIKKAVQWVKDLVAKRQVRDKKLEAAEVASEKVGKAATPEDRKTVEEVIADLTERYKSRWTKLDTIMIDHLNPGVIWGHEPIAKMAKAYADLTYKLVQDPKAVVLDENGRVANKLDFSAANAAASEMGKVSGQTINQVDSFKDIPSAVHQYGKYIRGLRNEMDPSGMEKAPLMRLLDINRCEYTRLGATYDAIMSANHNALNVAASLENKARSLDADGDEAKFARAVADALRSIAFTGQSLLSIREDLIQSREKFTQYRVKMAQAIKD